MEKEEVDALMRSIPTPTEAQQIELDLLSQRVAEEMRRNRKKNSAIETLMYLRECGIPFEEVLGLAKRISG